MMIFSEKRVAPVRTAIRDIVVRETGEQLFLSHLTGLTALVDHSGRLSQPTPMTDSQGFNWF